VSRLPVYSGKRLGTRVPRELVLPVFVVVVLFVALLISYPWPVLTLGTLAYLACLPLGWLSYRRLERAAGHPPDPPPPDEPPPPERTGPPTRRDRSDRDRPARLN